MSNKKIFVFGGTGSIGKALSKKLINNNYEPIIISRNENELTQLSNEIGCEYKVCDVLDFDKVKSISEEYNDRLCGIAFCVGSINFDIKLPIFFFFLITSKLTSLSCGIGNG